MGEPAPKWMQEYIKWTTLLDKVPSRYKKLKARVESKIRAILKEKNT